MRLGFATAPHLPDLPPDDRLVLPHLAALGIEVQPVLWTEPLPADLDALIIRSTWNYFEAFEAFEAWLQQLTQLKIPIANPPAQMLRNLSKAYLLELAAAGFPVIPTHYLPSESPLDLPFWVEHSGWPRLVVKPVISASGYATYILEAESELPADLLLAQRRAGLLLQPFVPSLLSEGEWSLVFFAGQFSHAVNKRPAPEQFLVHEEYGGTSTGRVPPPALLELARAVVAHEAANCLYARVDAVWHQQQWQVMEVELLEPALYLAQDAEAPARWAAAVRGWATQKNV